MTLIICCLILLSKPDSTVLFSDAVRYLSGASQFEILPEEEAEKYENLLRNPLKINSCSRSALSSSGLFSSYQVETIIDYRNRCGAICSAYELSVVDGFDERMAGYLSLFVDFDPSMNSQRHFDGEFSSFAVIKIASGKCNSQWMGRAKASYGELSASIAGKSEWSWPISLPKSIGCSLSYAPDAVWLSSMTIGYFNARFGQGLCLWSGMEMEKYATPSSLMKRPAGIMPYTSSSVDYAMRGAAASFSFGEFALSALYDCSSHKGAGNLTWHHRHGQIGLSGWADLSGNWCISADFQQIIGHFTLYGETTGLQSLLGVRALWNNIDIGLRAFYSKQEHSTSLSASWQSSMRNHILDFGSIVYGYPYGKGQTPAGGIQLKTLTTYTVSFDSAWSMVTRFASRTRNWTEPYRFDLRTDLRWTKSDWMACARINGLYCKSFSILGYLEGSYKKPVSATGSLNKFEVWLQGGVFFIDNWEDRIYVYQKDAPQSFNVPAMYGRGYWASVFSSIKLWKRLNLYLRGTWEDYPWALEGDTRTRPSLSVKFQLVVTL